MESQGVRAARSFVSRVKVRVRRGGEEERAVMR
jgi:hypothetical protein